MKHAKRGISQIIIMAFGIGILILVTVVGLVVDKIQTEAAKKEAAAMKKAMITPTPFPTDIPTPTNTRAPTPTIRISSPSATLAPVASASATVSSTVKPSASPTVAP